MSEADEASNYSYPVTPRLASTPATLPISAPPSQIHSPSLSRSPLLAVGDQIEPASKTPRTSTPRNATPRNLTPRIRTPRFITPLGSPIRKALKLTRLDLKMHGFPSLSSGMETLTTLRFTLFVLELVFKLLFFLLPFPFLAGKLNNQID